MGRYLAGETVTRVRAARVHDKYNPNRPKLDWTASTDLAIDDCAIWQTGADEPVEAARTAADYDYVIDLPVGSDVTAEDRLRVRGQLCDVISEPHREHNPFTGWEPGVTAKARAREG